MFGSERERQYHTTKVRKENFIVPHKFSHLEYSSRKLVCLLISGWLGLSEIPSLHFLLLALKALATRGGE